MEKDNKKEVGRRECERKSSWEEACGVDTFCWLVYKRHKHDPSMFCLFRFRGGGV